MMLPKIKLDKISKILPVIGIITFGLIIYYIGIEKIAYNFTIIPLEYYVLSFLLFIPGLLLSALAWQYICKKHKMDFSLFYLVKILLISTFYGILTPGGIGNHIRIFVFV
ncbi:MAG: flippase-like domain-containing protein [Thermoplasmatales archaeon]|nr:flippase-like domain-containing protein [Thermoplasmatales archaeon]